jgi:hypothetical protein
MRPKIDDTQVIPQTSRNPLVGGFSGRSPEPSANKCDHATRYITTLSNSGTSDRGLNRSLCWAVKLLWPVVMPQPD